MNAVNSFIIFAEFYAGVFYHDIPKQYIYDYFIFVLFNSRWHLNESVFKVCKKSIVSSSLSRLYMTNKSLLPRNKHFIYGLDI